MMKKTATGRIEQFTKAENDNAIICEKCTRIIVSKAQLGKDNTCPFCGEPIDLEPKLEN